MPPSPASSTRISLMGHADLPGSFAESRCFIYALCYSHLLHASFEEGQVFWLKKDLQLLNTMFISDTLQQCLHLKLPLCFVCSGATDWKVFTRCRGLGAVSQSSTVFMRWGREGQSPLLPAPAEWCWREIALRSHLWWGTGKVQGPEGDSSFCTWL